MIGRRQRGQGAAALGLAVGLSAPALGQRKGSILRVVPFSEPHVFDPHQSQVNSTSVHAESIYDTLFSWAADMVPRPQMVEHWNKSEDGHLYTFTLRPDLKCHDGSAVTTRDVIPSLQRLLLRDSQIQILAARVERLDRVDDRTFTLRLKAAFNYTEFLLGGSNGVSGVIMREQDARTDPYTPVKNL